MKHYEAYRETASPFLKVVPSHWVDTKIGQGYVEKSIGNNQGEQLLSVFLNRGVVSYTDTDMKQVHKPSEDMSAYQLVEPGDFVLNNQQAWRGSVGVSTYRGIVSPAYIVMRQVIDCNPRFMNYMLRETACISQFVLASKGVGSIQRILSPIKLKASIMVLPPRAEQDQIVRYLDWQVSKINRLIAAKKKQIELLKDNLKSAIATLAVEGIRNHEMCDSQIYWLDHYPADWRVTKLKYILKKHRREVQPNAELLICSNSGEVAVRGDTKLGLVASSDDIYQGVCAGDLLIHGMDTWHGAIAISDYDGMCTVQQRGYKLFEHQKMDYLMIFSHQNRVVIEIDGKQHYAEGDTASPRLYSEMMKAHREMSLYGYDVYRFGGYEFIGAESDPVVKKRVIENLKSFFRKLLQKYGILQED